MSELIVATSCLPENALKEIKSGLRYRIDYLELADRLGADHVDYSDRSEYPHFLGTLEDSIKLDLYWAMRLGNRVRRMDYDTVFSMSERIAIPMTFTLPDRAHHVVMLHHPMSPKKLRFLKYSGVARRWDKALVFSQAEQEKLAKEMNLAEGQTDTLHFPIDTDFFHPIDGPSKEEQEDFIFSIGLSHRDYPTLLKALRFLPEVKCRLSGTSAWVSHKAGYENEILPGNVEVRNYDHPHLIRQIYAQCRFVVIPIDPTTTQWSAGAASVLQPQAMGKPVIATRMPGLSDYVDDGVTGLLVEGGNPEEMAGAIQELWEDPVKTEKMGQAAAKWVQDYFSLDAWLDQIMTMFKTL